MIISTGRDYNNYNNCNAYYTLFGSSRGGGRAELHTAIGRGVRLLMTVGSSSITSGRHIWPGYSLFARYASLPLYQSRLIVTLDVGA